MISAVYTYPVQTESELDDFVLFPWKIYKNDKNWVPPLISERKKFFNPQKNPFFQHSKVQLFLARRENQLLGRIAVCINHLHNDFHKEKAGFFGFFECVNDYEVAATLFTTAKIWLANEGMEIMRGPANFSSNEEWGFLTLGFDKPPVIMLPYNPAYYPDFAVRYGFQKAKDLVSYYMTTQIPPPERVQRMAKIIRKKENLFIRNLNLRNLDSELQIIKKIYNATWTKNWGFVPLTDSEIDYMASELKQVVDPKIVYLAFVNGQPAAFSISLPNINPILKKINGKLFPFGIFKLLWYTKFKKIVDGARVYGLGVMPEYQKRGIDLVFYVDTFYDSIKRGYTWGELGWILEDNFLIRSAVETLAAKVYKTFRIYEMKI